MSTKNKQRAKKAVLLLLGVSSVATMGLMISQQDSVNQDDDNINIDPEEALNHSDNILNQVSKINDNEEEIEENNILIDDASKAPPAIPVSKNEMVIKVPNIEQFEKVSVIATGYTAGKESTGKDPSHPEYGITYSGVYVRRDVFSTIAADLDIFPLGTVLYIPDYGFGVVADKGSAIKGEKIDLYFETVEEVYRQWGKKRVDVYIIKRGEGKVTEKILDQYNRVATVNAVL